MKKKECIVCKTYVEFGVYLTEEGGFIHEGHCAEVLKEHKKRLTESADAPKIEDIQLIM